MRLRHTYTRIGPAHSGRARPLQSERTTRSIIAHAYQRSVTKNIVVSICDEGNNVVRAMDWNAVEEESRLADLEVALGLDVQLTCSPLIREKCGNNSLCVLRRVCQSTRICLASSMQAAML